MEFEFNAAPSAVLVKLPTKFESLEIICIDLLDDFGNRLTRIITMYRPPANDHDVLAVQYAKLLFECIDYLCNCKISVVVCGDFNFFTR